MSYNSVKCPGHDDYVKNGKIRVNVGTIGHVDHGKTSLSNAISRYESTGIHNPVFSYLTYFFYLDESGKLLYLSGTSPFMPDYLEDCALEYFEQTGHRLFKYESLQLYPHILIPQEEAHSEIEKDEFYQAQYSDFIRERS